MKCSKASGSITSQKPAFFSLILQSRSMIHRHTEIWKWQGSATASPLIQEIFCYLSKWASTISLMYKRKNKGPRIKPWGTPEFTDVQSEFAPGRTTLCFLLCRLSVNYWRSEPAISAIWSVKRRPLCHTLSKALVMSQKIARTSLPSSRALQKVL